MSLTQSINNWVEEQLEGSHFENIRDKKVIRDAVLDTNRFLQHEINVIDLPIVQRLRRISQTGFVNFVYPSATHSRFQHTLGVMVLATKIAKALRDKDEKMMCRQTIYEIRLAAIFHDLGHGPFSHISESVYFSYPNIFKDVINELKTNPKFSKCKKKPHEMLSYLIVSSQYFDDFFKDNLSSKDYDTTINLKNVANMIVGDMDDLQCAYMSDIINGSFDADKLDYIPRDCYFTGMKMGVDIDRILYTISIDKMKTFGRQGLIIDISGSPFIEQILFDKMMLYPSLYHHHKVRTLECMLRAIFEVVIDNNLTINNRSFNEITDFLSVTDTDILSLEGKPEEVKPYIKNILNRQLLKRALVISKSTIKKPEGLSKEEAEDYVDMKYQKLLELIAKPERIKDLRYCIAQEVGNLTVYDVWIDLPEAPSFREASQTVIKITEDKRKTLSRIFRVDKWITSYEENKWKGHVFAPPEHRKEVYKASKKIFKQELDIDFNEYAKIFAKCD